MQENEYRLNVGVIVANKYGNLLLCKRKGMNSWQFPQGGIDFGENSLKAAKRELFEEVGISSKSVKLIDSIDDWLKYDIPKKSRRKKIFKTNFKGQKQKWFIARFTGEEKEINLKTKDPEFIEWKWIFPEDLPTVIVNFKRDMYIELLKSIKVFIG